MLLVQKILLNDQINYHIIFIHFYRLLSIEVINGSLPTREVYQYNHRWSAAHTKVKFLSIKQKFQISSETRNDAGKLKKTISKKDTFKILDIMSYKLTCGIICEQFGEQTWFHSIDLFIAKNHLECVGDYFVNFVHEYLSRFEFQRK